MLGWIFTIGGMLLAGIGEAILTIEGAKKGADEAIERELQKKEQEHLNNGTDLQ